MANTCDGQDSFGVVFAFSGQFHTIFPLSHMKRILFDVNRTTAVQRTLHMYIHETDCTRLMETFIKHFEGENINRDESHSTYVVHTW